MHTAENGPHRPRIGVLASHPIQYQAPLFRALAERCELTVFFAHRQSPEGQSDAGFGVAFDWDVDLLSGFDHRFLANRAARPGSDRFGGCDTPQVAQEIAAGCFHAFVVMGWHLKSYWQAVRACRRAGVPVMVRGDSHLLTPRGALARAAKRLAYPWLLRRFDGWLYVGERNRQYLLHYGADPQRLFFAPHSVDVQGYARAAAQSDPGALRQAWGLEPGEQAVLFAGKLVPEKRAADLVEAVARLRSAGRQLRLVWAGDGPERPALLALGEARRVPMVFLGFCNQSRMPAIYRAADALALPSASETWGLVVNEALACGTPCVVSEACGCVPDLVLPGRTGASFAAGDLDAFAAALEAVLARPIDAAAAAALCKSYSPAATADGIVQASRRLAARKSGAAAPHP